MSCEATFYCRNNWGRHLTQTVSDICTDLHLELIGAEIHVGLLKVVLREISTTAEVSYMLARHLCLQQRQGRSTVLFKLFLTPCNCSQSHCGDFTSVSISQIALKVRF